MPAIFLEVKSWLSLLRMGEVSGKRKSGKIYNGIIFDAANC